MHLRNAPGEILNVKISALIYRGQLVEIAQVPDDFEFGEHGNHYHVEVKAVETHMCVENPTLSVEEVNDGGGDTDDLHH